MIKMNKIILLSFFLFNTINIFTSATFAAKDQGLRTQYPTLSSWVRACESLQTNREILEQEAVAAQRRQEAAAQAPKGGGLFAAAAKMFGFRFDQFETQPTVQQAKKRSGFDSCGDKQAQWNEFKGVLGAWLQMMSRGSLAQESNWARSDFTVSGVTASVAGGGAASTSERSGTEEDRIIYKTIPERAFFDVAQVAVPFTPFAQKMIAPPDAQFYMRGDLHGDIFAILKELVDLRNWGVIDDYFRIIQPNAWIAFLGDYVDRGHYGCEVLYTMMRLSLANPERVICVRGNHEDVDVSALYGFKAEIRNKFGDDSAGTKHRLIGRMNDFMPVVFYLGCKQQDGVTNYIQCCHGGIEIGYNPSPFLDDHTTKYQQLGVLHRHKMYELLPKVFPVNFMKVNQSRTGYFPERLLNEEEVPQYLQDDLVFNNPNDHYHLGLMWNDFDVLDQFQINLREGRGFRHGQLFTRDILQLHSSDTSKLRGIIRAHQHAHGRDAFREPMMKGLKESNGVYKLWKPYEKDQVRPMHDGLVWTFNVGADSVYGRDAQFDFDTYAKVIVKKDYKQWTMELFVQQGTMESFNRESRSKVNQAVAKAHIPGQDQGQKLASLFQPSPFDRVTQQQLTTIGLGKDTTEAQAGGAAAAGGGAAAA